MLLLKRCGSSGDARASDVLRAHGLGAFSKLPHVQPGLVGPRPRAQIELIGTHPLRDEHRALGVGLAFGHAEAETLIALAESASAHGARAVRPAPDRALLLIGIAEQDITASAHEAARLGFVTRADDPRRRIVACPGAPACASGFIAARKLALEFADLLGSHILQGKDLMHISGCAKGCAHPQPAALTIVGSARGCGIVEHGTARATPHTYVDPRQLAAYLAQRIDEPVHG